MNPSAVVPHWPAATQLIQQSGRILIASHLHPDGDAIGSMLALGLYLRQCGKEVDLAVDGGIPMSLSFLEGSASIGDAPKDGNWDLFISVDSSDEARTGVSGIFGREHSSKVLNVDHHTTNTQFGDVQLVIPTAVSTTEIIFLWLREMNAQITKDTAQALLTGLTTDTQGFRTDNVTAETLSIAKQLMERGASLSLIYQQTLNSRSYASVLLWQRVIPAIQLQDGVIFTRIRQIDWQETSIPPNHDGGLVNYLIQVNEAKIAALFSEISANEIKIELRSVSGCDVAQIASSLGGGGHQQASGCTLSCSIEEAINQVIPLLRSEAGSAKT